MADFLQQATTTSSHEHGHEANTLVLRGLILFAIGLVVVTGVVEFALTYVMKDFEREESTLQSLAPPRLADRSGTFPAPQLQAQPPVDLVKFKKDELQKLDGYGWVDRSRGIAHIPIDRAIEIVAAKGLSAVEDGFPSAATATSTAAGQPEAGKDGKK
jgi:hypothetical protein